MVVLHALCGDCFLAFSAAMITNRRPAQDLVLYFSIMDEGGNQEGLPVP